MTRTVLAGGTVIDGTGAAARIADVVIEDGLIVAIEEPGSCNTGAAVHDMIGMVLAPGFIDAHSHADNAPLLQEPDLSKVLQGVTTEVVGNCGLSLAPRIPRNADTLESYLRHFFPESPWTGQSFSDFLAATDDAGYIVNFAPLVGHGPLRIASMGLDAREATAQELRTMRSMLDEALDAGAIGMSSGLVYPPGRSSVTSELVELAHSLHDRNAIYSSHIRSEGLERMGAVNEAVSVGREAKVRVEISHHKAMGAANWGQVRHSLELVEKARVEGVDVRFDVYPYTASSTSLASCLPPRLLSLDDDTLLAQLRDPHLVESLRLELERGDWDNHVAQAGGYQGILVSSTETQSFVGSTLDELGRELGTDGAGALVHVLVHERLRATMVCFAMDEADVEAALLDPFTCIGSDGLPAGMSGKPHPRQWGTFPRVLGRYVRERKLLSLESAVHKMTALPADTFRLSGVGTLAAGFAADIVAFNPDDVIDRATYTDSVLPPAGIRDVFISGVPVVAESQFTGARVGRRLRAGIG